MVIEGWSAWDAFYMTVISITTAGYREVHDLSRAGQVFTSALLIVGVGTAFYAFTLVAAGVIESRLHPRIQEKRRARMIDHLTDHFILCGAGRIGLIIADEFRRQRVPFVVIDHDPAAVQAVLERGDLAVEADASREDILRRLRIDNARGLIAALGSDAENVYAILTARGLRPDLFVIARADSDDAGGSCSGRAPTAWCRRTRSARPRWRRPRCGRRSSTSSSWPPVPRTSNWRWSRCASRPRSGLVDRTILEANLRQRFGVIVVGIQREGGRMEFNPPPDAVMRADDQLVVLGRPEQLKDLEVAAQ